MAIEIVDFPIKHGGSFHSYVKLPEGNPFFFWHFLWFCQEPRQQNDQNAKLSMTRFRPLRPCAEIVRFLVERGARISAKDDAGETSLMKACFLASQLEQRATRNPVFCSGLSWGFDHHWWGFKKFESRIRGRKNWQMMVGWWLYGIKCYLVDDGELCPIMGTCINQPEVKGITDHYGGFARLAPLFFGTFGKWNSPATVGFPQGTCGWTPASWRVVLPIAGDRQDTGKGWHACAWGA